MFITCKNRIVYVYIFSKDEYNKMRNFTKQYINGEWVDSASGETIDVINPATEEVMGKIAKGNEEDVNKAVDAADKSIFRI